MNTNSSLSPREAVVFLFSPWPGLDRAAEIAVASVHVRLVGALAETTVTLVLHNPNDRDMEGELSYPLPPDAAMQGYALDIDGAMVDGVPVPKQKARAAFEEEQRRGIDPGLVEWSGGNRFKTRVSPIPAHGQRRIRLRYTGMVQQGGQGDSYRLPLDFEHVGCFHLRIEAVNEQQPLVRPTGLGTLSFTPWQSRFVLEHEWHELALHEDIVVDLPQGMAEAPSVERYEDAFYFARLVELPADKAQPLPAPERVDIVWDASGSMAQVNREPALECLRLYFASRAAIPCTVRVTVLRHEAGEPRDFRVEQGDVTELLSFLAAQGCDGATGDIAAALASDAPLRFLLTDGAVNFRVDEAPAPAPGGLTYALVSGSGVDMAALRQWGAIPLDLLRQTPAQALAAVPSCRLAAVMLDGQTWEDARTNAPLGLVEGPLLLTGTLPAGRHEVQLLFQGADGGRSCTFTADTAGAAEGALNRSFHAQNLLAALLATPECPAREQQLRALGESYGIVTPGTSLLVLENLEQYLRHEVRPPACCSELRRRYDTRIAERARENAKARGERLSRQRQTALRERCNLQDWYDKDFSPVLRRAERCYDSPAPASEPLRNAPEDLERTPRRTLFRRFMASRVHRSDVGLVSDEAHSAAPTSPGASEPTSSRCDEPGETIFFAAAPSRNESPRLSRWSVWPAPGEDACCCCAPVPTAESLPCASPEPAPCAAGPEDSRLAEPMGGAESFGAEPEPETTTIHMQAWSSDAPYLRQLAEAADAEACYMELRPAYAASPGFYLDCADWFEKAGRRAMAVRVLSNLLEMELENRGLMRAAAYQLRYLGESAKAVILLRKVVELFPEEPQSYRDLGLALADCHRWQEAVDALRLVLEKPMDNRFEGVEQVAAIELAHTLACARREGVEVKVDGLDSAYLTPMEFDLRVVINWDTDMSDMDLWVTDPLGEKCYYGNRFASKGGHLSRDVTQGYGPEEFLIRSALPGKYKVQTHYFGTRTMKMLAPVTLYAEIYTDYGRPDEKRRTLVFRLSGHGEEVHVADIAYEGRQKACAPCGPRDYQVRANESWESIAARELGDAARAGEIIDLNPGASPLAPPRRGAIIRLPKA